MSDTTEPITLEAYNPGDPLMDANARTDAEATVTKADVALCKTIAGTRSDGCGNNVPITIVRRPDGRLRVRTGHRRNIGCLRAGHQTWMEEAGISDLLQAERMGHEVPGMRGVYGHVTPAMRAALTAMLQRRWEASLHERAQLSLRSIVPVLDTLLTAQREPPGKIGSHFAPKIGHQRDIRLAERKSGR